MRSIILLLLLASAITSCSKNSETNEPTPSEIEAQDRARQLKSDFVVEPAVGYIITKPQLSWEGSHVDDSMASKVSSLEFEFKGATKPVEAQVIDGKGKVTVKEDGSIHFEATEPGTTIIKFKDANQRIGHSVILTSRQPKFSQKNVSYRQFNTSKCETTDLSATGGFPPYKYKLLSGEGSLNYDRSGAWTFTAPEIGKTITLEVEDSQGNRQTLKDIQLVQKQRDFINRCYGTNGLASLEIPAVRPTSYEKVAKFSPVAITEEPRRQRLFAVGTSKSPLSRYEDGVIVAYDMDGKVDKSFNSDNVFFGSFLRPDAVSVDQNGKIYIAGISGNSGQGIDLFVRRVNDDGYLDRDFGSNGDFNFTVSKVIEGIFIPNDRGVRVDKIFIQNSQTGVRILVSYYFFGHWAGIIALNAQGELDSSFGDRGQIVVETSSRDIIPQAKDKFHFAVGPQNEILAMRSSPSNQNTNVRMFDSNGKKVFRFGKSGEYTLKHEIPFVADKIVALPGGSFYIVGVGGIDKVSKRIVFPVTRSEDGKLSNSTTRELYGDQTASIGDSVITGTPSGPIVISQITSEDSSGRIGVAQITREKSNYSSNISHSIYNLGEFGSPKETVIDVSIAPIESKLDNSTNYRIHILTNQGIYQRRVDSFLK